jgi:O-antigen/teichoic acid export membrane protein
MSLRHQVAVAAFTSGAVEMVTRVLTIVLSIATARALQPSEVGLLGLAVIIVGVLSLVAACAETAGVVARALGSDTQHAWAATVTRAGITAFLLAVAPFSLPPVAYVLAGKETASADLMALVYVLLWQLGLDLAATYPRILLQRRLNLTSLVGASLLQITTHVGLSVVLLWKGYGAMGVVSSALVSGGLCGAFLWSRLLAQRGVQWGGGVDAGMWSQTMGSTARVFVGSFAGYLNGRLSNLLVAGMLGPTAMSFYGMAWSASRIPVWVLSQALGLVLVPTLTHVRSDPERVERVLRESLRHAYVLLVPACTTLFITADSLVIVALGAKWLPIVPALRVMSAGVLLVPLVIALNGLLVAMDRAHLVGLATATQLGIIVVSMGPLAIRWGVVGAALADLASTIVMTIVLLALCRLSVPAIRWDMVPAVLPVVAAVSSGLLALGLSAEVTVGLTKIVSQTCVILGGYLVIVWLLGGWGRLMELVKLIQSVIRRPPPTVAVPVRSEIRSSGNADQNLR